MENELVDLIDELLERDAGTVNSTIIGKLFKYQIHVHKVYEYMSEMGVGKRLFSLHMGFFIFLFFF